MDTDDHSDRTATRVSVGGSGEASGRSSHGRATSKRGAFACRAIELARHGLCPVPCDGKKPMPGGRSWKSAPSLPRYEQLVAREALRDAGIGLLTRLSGLAVVDCDAADLHRQVEKVFGRTPKHAAGRDAVAHGDVLPWEWMCRAHWAARWPINGRLLLRRKAKPHQES